MTTGEKFDNFAGGIAPRGLVPGWRNGGTVQQPGKPRGCSSCAKRLNKRGRGIVRAIPAMSLQLRNPLRRKKKLYTFPYITK